MKLRISFALIMSVIFLLLTSYVNFDRANSEILGTNEDLLQQKKLNVKLKKEFHVGSEDITSSCEGKEVLQKESLKDKYFKVVLDTQLHNSLRVEVNGVKIFDKKTNKVLQEICNLDCENRDVNCISLGDFNFDGYVDFSIFEAQYAGANTSSLYFLYNPKKNLFYDSGFKGTSLMFDKKTKTVHGTNQCCAGTSVEETTYKILNNKMILLKKNCYKWDDNKRRRVKTRCDN